MRVLAGTVLPLLLAYGVVLVLLFAGRRPVARDAPARPAAALLSIVLGGYAVFAVAMGAYCVAQPRDDARCVGRALVEAAVLGAAVGAPAIAYTAVRGPKRRRAEPR